MLKNLLAFLRIAIVYFLLSIVIFLMLRIIVGYLSFKTDVQFLARKQEYIHDRVWMVAFYVHVFSAVVALLAGFTQFARKFTLSYRRLHRWMGRVYVIDILLINVPAGMILAVYANGMLPGRIAFVTLDLLWFWFTFDAYRQARAKNFAAHRRQMIRSYALTFSAITLRSWKMGLSHVFTIDPLHLYIIDAYLGFIPNLLVAEYIIRREGFRGQRLNTIKPPVSSR